MKLALHSNRDQVENTLVDGGLRVQTEQCGGLTTEVHHSTLRVDEHVPGRGRLKDFEEARDARIWSGLGLNGRRLINLHRRSIGIEGEWVE